MQDIKYRHKKTGKIYKHIVTAIDCTNSRDGTKIIVYCREDDDSVYFVRDAREHSEKFEIIENNGAK